MKIMVTGGAGFIGSSVVRRIIQTTPHTVLNLDALTYASNLKSLSTVETNDRYQFVRGNVRDQELMKDTLCAFNPDIIMHLAAETHVDKSIAAPTNFIETNILGTYALLEATRTYWSSLPSSRQASFRFHHISTDEVFGSLGAEGSFNENSRYAPNSPYSASKASSDHLVRAWHQTYGIPVVTSNCSNNYGPYQYPEKLIPRTIVNILKGHQIPVYGSGLHVRDWLYVDDHANGLLAVAMQGVPGEVYNIGAVEEHTNMDVVQCLCDLLDELHPCEKGSYSRLISHVPDRAGHDARYAVDPSKIMRDLKWRPKETFRSGLQKTVQWHLDNRDWWAPPIASTVPLRNAAKLVSP